ncbi:MULTISPECIES: sodium/glutamate symporter [Anaerococcus]|jgi:ESS family glutamate:sodium|uniref:Sodium:glutamate symporter n=1 Tax=Anaerococcus nagyae TaxID=1755241 RepID=A0A3E2TLH2_9FIRM|nr:MULTISPECIES: sodium/glutamate symporter [Anaerococcus]MDU2565087.1 sodium/glutamate symporter [Anaerococcus sp.]RGB78219.1 sodium:glutamate symporter [Anaerococcus nagyae]
MDKFLSYFGELSKNPGEITSFKFEYLTTLGLAAIVIFLGRFLVSKSKALQKYAIPAPVVSGIIFSLIISLIKTVGIIDLTFDAEVTKDLAQNLFFLAVGYSFSTELMKSAGSKLVLRVTWVSCLLILLQDLLGLGAAKVLGLNPYLGLQASSAGMSGGVGTAAAFGPIFQSMGAPNNVTEFGVAAGTMGNIMGSLVGGPVAAYLIRKHNLKSDPNDKPETAKKNIVAVIDNTKMIRSFAMMLLIAAIGIPVKYLLDLIPLIQMPKFIGCLFAGVIARYIKDKSGSELYIPEVNAIQDMFLELYLALVLMTIDITAIASQASSLVVILLLQAILIAVFTLTISFKAFGSDYGAAVMAAGNCGWGCGSGPNAVANVKAVMQEYGYHNLAWVFYPSFAVIIDDIFNPILLSVLGSLLR